MFQRLLQILFGTDHRFLGLRTEGMPAPVLAAMAEFWSEPAYAELSFRDALVAADFKGLVGGLEGLATGQTRGGDAALWQSVAERSATLAPAEPVAAALVGLQAMAAWVGALGKNLFFQPWQGHHPGWHLFPLVVARNLVAADAVWAARFTCDTACGFIGSAKDAPFDERLRGVIAEYEAVRAEAERIYNECVDELAWELHASAATPGEGFRAELAALFWTAGDVGHADLMRPDGPAGYLPPYAMVRSLVERDMRRLPRAPLTQYVWLEMKDRGPFSLRGHKVLFGHVNNRFHGHPLHDLDDVLPVSISRAYAKAAIGWMGDAASPEAAGALGDALALVGELIEARAPEAYLRLAALATLLGTADAQTRGERWDALARLSAAILQWADHGGIYEPFDRVLDVPFSALPVHSVATLEQALDRIEAYRQSNLGYWLAISPPLGADVAEDLLAQEADLLRELRGARFIRLLPHLPSHYRRYGFRIDEALEGPPPGAAPVVGDGGLLKFDPFDQDLAARNLRDARERLLRLYEEMRTTSPAYAAVRIAPRVSAADFTGALGAHRGA